MTKYLVEFLDDFAVQVRENRERLSQILQKGRVSELDSDLAELLNQVWKPVSAAAENKEIIAIDGSRATRNTHRAQLSMW